MLLELVCQAPWNLAPLAWHECWLVFWSAFWDRSNQPTFQQFAWDLSCFRPFPSLYICYRVLPTQQGWYWTLLFDVPSWKSSKQGKSTPGIGGSCCCARPCPSWGKNRAGSSNAAARQRVSVQRVCQHGRQLYLIISVSVKQHEFAKTLRCQWLNFSIVMIQTKLKYISNIVRLIQDGLVAI